MKKIIPVIITIIYFLVLCALSYYIYRLNIIPNRYLLIAYGLIFLVTTLLIINLFKRKSTIKVISGIILIIMIWLFAFVTYYFNNTYHFLEKTQVKYDTISYSVLVLNNSEISNIKDLNNQNISYLKDSYNEEIKNNLVKKIDYEEIIVSDLSKLYEALNKGETKAIVLEESYITLANEEIDNFKDNTKVIYSFNLKVKSYKEESNISITNEAFIIYISGIDQYGNVNSVRGRSDVNQLLVINPKTHKILIVNTPRDYYVQLAGTTGLRDKLTHAGIYGINKSIETIEELYDIDINHYIRINFDTLIKVVDVIGGIDIYSDKAFKPWTNSHVYINKGWNHLNGKEALAYARERKTYVDGDHHRGRNQQQIIEAIINKLTNTNTFLSKYNSILNSLDGSFQTDIDTSLLTSFIKYQLDKMPKWNIESIQTTGFNSWNYTYSMGYNYYLWVMEPDWNSVKETKEKIQEVLLEKVGE